MLTHLGTQQILTERLILRKFEYTDSDDMLKYWISDPNVQSMYCEPVYSTKQEVKDLLTKYIDSYKKEDYYRWAIIHSDTNECIGQIAYFLVDSKNHFAEIEYCIGGKFQGKAYATESTKCVINFGFEEMNLHKVQICHMSTNAPSKKVIEKCKLVYEGKLRDFIFTGDGYIDRLYYSILRDEYITLQKDDFF